jgi:hypothetical protein
MAEAISPLNLNSQTMPIMAAKNKSLAENNKSRIGGKATKNRSFQRSLPQERYFLGGKGFQVPRLWENIKGRMKNIDIERLKNMIAFQVRL